MSFRFYVNQKKFLNTLLFLVFFVSGIFFTNAVFGASCNSREEGGAGSLTSFRSSIVPCGLSCDYPDTPYDESKTCTMCHFLILLKNIYDFLFSMIVIASLLFITIGGVMYIISTGNASMKGNGKAIITKTITGFVVAMLSWVIVYSILSLLSANGALSSIAGGSFTFTCDLDSKFAGEYSNYTGSLYTSGGVPVYPQKVDVDPSLLPTVDPAEMGTWTYQTGIANQRSAHASRYLNTLLDCMDRNDKLPAAAKVISSISDSQILGREILGDPNAWDLCAANGNWNRPPCAHSLGSMHYGGRNPNCIAEKKSFAVDLAEEQYWKEYRVAADACIGEVDAAVQADGRKLNGTKYFFLVEGNHVHLHLNITDTNGVSCQFNQ